MHRDPFSARSPSDVRGPAPVIALLIALTLAPLSAAQADDVAVTSRITAVTVQLDRATVHREATLNLETGEHRLTFPDLPAALDRQSLRLAVLGSGLDLGLPVFREVETARPVNPAAARLTDELEQLQRRRRVEEDRIAVQELLLDVLRRPDARPATEGGQAVAELDSLIGLIETRSSEAFSRIRSAREDLETILADIDRTRRELDRLGPDPMRRLEVALPVERRAAGPVGLELAYEVRKASFTPSFEARLDSDTGELTLLALAEVIQSTGEDWPAVELTLSTAVPGWRTAAPEAEPWYIDIETGKPEPAPPAARAGAEKALLQADVGAVAIDRTGFDATYRLTRPVTIEADGTAHRVTIETVRGTADLDWRAWPEVDPQAWLTASFDYPGDAPLLPGPVLLYRDGAAIGEAGLSGLQPGEPLELGFDADPAISIERRLLTDERSATGLIGTTRRHERRFATTVTNRRPDPVTLQLLDRLPVPRDTRITVERLQDTTPPTTTAPDDKPGVLVWRLELPPGASETVTFGYRVSHPADLRITGF